MVFAADTLSIAVTEVVDNAVMALIPNAMEAVLVNWIFWVAMAIALTVAFFAAYPVNRYLLQRGKGHALTHQYHHSASGPVSGARRYIPIFPTSTLIADPTRARLLYALDVAEELGVGDLALVLSASEDADSYGLGISRTAGLVTRRKEGRVVYYRLAEGFPSRCASTACASS